MLYLGNASTPAIRAAMHAGELGQMCSPAERRDPLSGVPFALDNGCYGHGWVDEQHWLAWLARLAPHARRCLFATAPDVPGDATATLARSRPHLATIQNLGYPAGLVAQEGLDQQPIPWDEFDVLFVGGLDTAWKLGPIAASLVTQALQRGKKVHFGRCNSARRWHYAQSLGCQSADGTFLIYAPCTNLARFRRWSTTRPHMSGARPARTTQPSESSSSKSRPRRASRPRRPDGRVAHCTRQSSIMTGTNGGPP